MGVKFQSNVSWGGSPHGSGSGSSDLLDLVDLVVAITAIIRLHLTLFKIINHIYQLVDRMIMALAVVENLVV